MQPNSEGECKSTIVLPAVCQVWISGKYLSEFGAPFTSQVKTVPSGKSVQPSSELKSNLPVCSRRVQVRVTGSKAASCWSSFLPSNHLPSGRTHDCESPIKAKPSGGGRSAQVFVSGS